VHIKLLTHSLSLQYWRNGSAFDKVNLQQQQQEAVSTGSSIFDQMPKSLAGTDSLWSTAPTNSSKQFAGASTWSVSREGAFGSVRFLSS